MKYFAMQIVTSLEILITTFINILTTYNILIMADLTFKITAQSETSGLSIAACLVLVSTPAGIYHLRGFFDAIASATFQSTYFQRV